MLKNDFKFVGLCKVPRDNPTYISSYQQSYIKITNLESYFVILGFMDLVQPISIVGALLNKIYGLIFNGVIQGAIYP